LFAICTHKYIYIYICIVNKILVGKTYDILDFE